MFAMGLSASNSFTAKSLTTKAEAVAKSKRVAKEQSSEQVLNRLIDSEPKVCKPPPASVVQAWFMIHIAVIAFVAIGCKRVLEDVWWPVG